MEIKEYSTDSKQSSLQPSGKSPYQAAFWFALGVFLLAFLVSTLYARSLEDQNKKDFQVKLAQDVGTLRSHTSSSIEGYSRLLLSAVALFSVKPDVTRDDWLNFFDLARKENNFPNIVGMGYASAITADQADTFQQQQRDTGQSDFTVSTSLSTGRLGVITYLSPDSPENTRALGYDMFAEPNRRVAMQKARDDAGIVMTSPVKLVQDGDRPKVNGVLIYYPIYEGKSTPATLEARRELIRGYAYIVLRPADILQQFVDSHGLDFSNALIEVSDTTNPRQLVPLYHSPGAGKSTESVEETLNVDTRTWRLHVASRNLASRQIGPVVVFVLGGIVSLLVSGFTYWLLSRRIKRITTAYEGEVKRTKDELLALASHQLRTPASGVKQYLGILSSGVVGALSSEQQSVAKKAYEANERQLQIINELLYVSKADAGQLVIEPKQFDITELTRRCIDNVGEQAAQKNITIVFPTKRRHEVTADDRYISMVVDNLISNAIKYSYPSSSVKISLSADANFVSLHVKDRGVGVDSDDVERIFGKFDRVDNPLSHIEGGSGLGLFLARQLARAHGGDVTVESQLEQGSTFTLMLPKQFTINDSIVYLDGAKKIKEES